MRVLGIALILQIGMVFFAWYQSYKNEEKLCKYLDVRVFWGIALFFNLGGIFLTIYDYKCVLSGQYDLVFDEIRVDLYFFIVLVLLSFIDILAIYLLTKKCWNTKKILRAAVYVSVLALLIVFKILISSLYMRSLTILFIVVTIFPVLISLCTYFGVIKK